MADDKSVEEVVTQPAGDQTVQPHWAEKRLGEVSEVKNQLVAQLEQERAARQVLETQINQAATGQSGQRFPSRPASAERGR